MNLVVGSRGASHWLIDLIWLCLDYSTNLIDVRVGTPTIVVERSVASLDDVIEDEQIGLSA